eukprot:TRINITY_DN7078_c0_g1_i1.p1 TRINITY_DN7078_c0_g1~~TRINITY_DN7078_c0_g1_i1.p1  ORF type:complete len:257 (-),score=30.56 TRINITY_DN7078_c0_g1_i1:363-1133(-)
MSSIYPKLIPISILDSRRFQLGQPLLNHFVPEAFDLNEYFYKRIKFVTEPSIALMIEPLPFIYANGPTLSNKDTKNLSLLMKIYKIMHRTAVMRNITLGLFSNIQSDKAAKIGCKVAKGAIKILSCIKDLCEPWSNVIFDSLIRALLFIHFNSPVEAVEAVEVPKIVTGVYREYYRKKPDVYSSRDKDRKDLDRNESLSMIESLIAIPAYPIDLNKLQWLGGEITFPKSIATPVIFDHYYPYHLKVLFSHLIPSVI